ncbi:MAG: rhomboid family intramembrane serine protease [Phycisphaeraceae bacterium]|nr:rhomboid family intramembrane serine protease [Phycisphaeraceae bacterium]
MGLQDRGYMQGDNAPPGLRPARGGGLPFSMSTLLIAINVIIELFRYVAFSVWQAMFDWGHFSTTKAIFGVEFWRFLTFQFLHANLVHLAFNMLGIWFLGRLVEDQLGPKKYLAFYLVCGIFGGLMYLLLNFLGGVIGISLPGLLMNDPATPLIGASAGVFGVVMACAYIAPNAVVQLIFPPIPMKMKTFAYGFVALALVMLLIGSTNAGGEAAHLGGAIAGFYFIRNTHHLIDFFDVLGDSRKPKSPKPPRHKRGGGASQQEVDRVLEKVSASGLGSLTSQEREILRHATKQQRRG